MGYLQLGQSAVARYVRLETTPPIVYFPTLHQLNENDKNRESRNRGGTAVEAR